MNQLRASQDAARAQQRAELAKVTRDLDRLVQALLDGVRGSQVKEKMAELEARKRKLEAELEQGAPAPCAFTRTWGNATGDRSRA